jgi:hypothetical protein
VIYAQPGFEYKHNKTLSGRGKESTAAPLLTNYQHRTKPAGVLLSITRMTPERKKKNYKVKNAESVANPNREEASSQLPTIPENKPSTVARNRDLIVGLSDVIQSNNA